MPYICVTVYTFQSAFRHFISFDPQNHMERQESGEPGKVGVFICCFIDKEIYSLHKYYLRFYQLYCILVSIIEDKIAQEEPILYLRYRNLKLNNIEMYNSFQKMTKSNICFKY